LLEDAPLPKGEYGFTPKPLISARDSNENSEEKSYSITLEQSESRVDT